MRPPGGRVHRSYVFYGRSNTGKTTLACGFPGPVLLMDINDAGDDSVTGNKNVSVLDVKDWASFETYYWWLLRNPGAYKTIIIDTASQLQQAAIVKVLSDQKKDPERAGEWGKMTKKEWGEVASLMKVWLTRFRDLPCEVVFIAQDRTSGNEGEDGEGMIDPEVGPALTPSVAKHLNAIVHIIGNTFIRRRMVKVKVKEGKATKTVTKERIEYCLRVGPNAVYVTKIRKPKHLIPPSVLVNPSYEALTQLVTGAAS